jgi:hypothetical protein
MQLRLRGSGGQAQGTHPELEERCWFAAWIECRFKKMEGVKASLIPHESLTVFITTTTYSAALFIAFNVVDPAPQ